MGQIEKIVVLIVLFLVAVIFVVTLNPPAKDAPIFDMNGRGSQGKLVAEIPAEPLHAAPLEDEQQADQPGEGGNGAGLTFQERRALDQSQGLARESATQRPDLLLDAGLSASDGSGATKLERQLPEGSALITLEGLQDSWDDDIKEYVWRKQDTFGALAQRFYGQRDMVRLLRQFNEDVSYKRPGETILVPVFDRRGGAFGTPGAGVSGEVVTTSAGKTYKVAEGDSLWVISKKVYGKGSRWEEIYKANQDKLTSPDDVSVDMLLVIP